MATMTIRHLDDHLKQQLRIRAALHSHSMEQEVREILRTALSAEETKGASGQALVNAVRSRLDQIGGADLELPAREPVREPPDFSA